MAGPSSPYRLSYPGPHFIAVTMVMKFNLSKQPYMHWKVNTMLHVSVLVEIRESFYQLKLCPSNRSVMWATATHYSHSLAHTLTFDYKHKKWRIIKCYNCWLNISWSSIFALARGSTIFTGGKWTSEGQLGIQVWVESCMGSTHHNSASDWLCLTLRW